MSQPKWIADPDGLHGRALSVWKSYATGAFKAGYLKSDNAEVFRAMCRVLAVADAAGEAIERDGVTIELKSGVKRPNPAVKIMFDAQREAAKLLRDFGLSDNAFGL